MATGTPYSLRRIATHDRHKRGINRMSWSRDGVFLATPDDAGIVLVSEGLELAPKARLHHRQMARINAVDFNHDGSLLAACGDWPFIVVFEVGTETVIRQIDLEAPRVHGLRWSPDGRFLANTTADGNLVIWRTSDWTVSRRIEAHRAWVNWVTWCPGGSTLYSAGGDGDCELVASDLKSGTPLWRVSREDAVMHCAASRSGDRVAAATIAGAVVVVDTESGELVRELRVHEGAVKCVDFSYDDHFLASKSDDGTVKVTSTNTWEVVAQIDEPTNRWPAGLQFHPSAPLLATLGQSDRGKDRSVLLWAYGDPDQLAEDEEGAASRDVAAVDGRTRLQTARRATRGVKTIPPGIAIPEDAALTAPMQLKQLGAKVGMSRRQFKEWLLRVHTAVIVVGRQQYQLWLDPLRPGMRARFED